MDLSFTTRTLGLAHAHIHIPTILRKGNHKREGGTITCMIGKESLGSSYMALNSHLETCFSFHIAPRRMNESHKILQNPIHRDS